MIRRAQNLFLCLLLFVAACDSEPRVPDDILPPHRMKAVLRDVFTADDWVQFRRETDTTYNRADSSIVLYRSILLRHRISEAVFKKSFRYYESRPELLKEVIDALQAPPPKPVGDNAPAPKKL
ncbi:DUF4296 domain-containing protein [Flaviaesturariibacter amylovorans]|uniref:DUF4296 domain-containing protein n=1 Tax=Flaviaesturariibacter amylovorans TaxID=1084520 RepID=A0ABP8GIY5_9BACT